MNETEIFERCGSKRLMILCCINTIVCLRSWRRRVEELNEVKTKYMKMSAFEHRRTVGNIEIGPHTFVIVNCPEL